VLRRLQARIVRQPRARRDDIASQETGALNTCTSWVNGYIADRTEAAKAWIWNGNGAWAAGWICGSPLFGDGAAGCLEVG
jgi:hypothetical protein